MDKKILGDKRTHGARNIPMFWSTKRYFKENVYHCIASICLWLVLLFAIIFIIVANALGWTAPNKSPDTKISMGLAVPTFAFLLTFCICKINERKIRKQRVNDIASSISRTIES